MFNNFFKGMTKKQWSWIGALIGLVLIIVVIIGLKVHHDNVESEGEYPEDTSSAFESINEKADDSYESIQEDIDSESESIDKDTASKSSISSKSSSSIDTDESLDNLKSIISMPMAKENYQNLEDGVLESAKVDDINGNATQGDLTRFHSRVSNIRDKADEAKSLYSDNKGDLTSDDQTKLKDYKKLLVNYLNALGDYAVTYQSDNPVINTQDTDSETVSEYQQELQKAQDKFTNAKNEWSASYDSIMNS